MADIIQTEIPENPFLAFRERAGVSRQVMARAMGVTTKTLEYLERGWARRINDRVLVFLELAGEDPEEVEHKYREYYKSSSFKARDHILAQLRAGV
jgi:DNA-binding XRE family transcriptional regulator